MIYFVDKMAGVSAKDKAPVEGMQKIDLTTLSIPQLAQLKQNLEQVSNKHPSLLPHL